MLQLFTPNWHRSTLFWHNSQLKFQTFFILPLVKLWLQWKETWIWYTTRRKTKTKRIIIELSYKFDTKVENNWIIQTWPEIETWKCTRDEVFPLPILRRYFGGGGEKSFNRSRDCLSCGTFLEVFIWQLSSSTTVCNDYFANFKNKTKNSLVKKEKVEKWRIGFIGPWGEKY
jgi:hypothetical protein